MMIPRLSRCTLLLCALMAMCGCRRDATCHHDRTARWPKPVAHGIMSLEEFTGHYDSFADGDTVVVYAFIGQEQRYVERDENGTRAPANSVFLFEDSLHRDRMWDMVGRSAGSQGDDTFFFVDFQLYVVMSGRNSFCSGFTLPNSFMRRAANKRCYVRGIVRFTQDLDRFICIEYCRLQLLDDDVSNIWIADSAEDNNK